MSSDSEMFRQMSLAQRILSLDYCRCRPPRRIGPRSRAMGGSIAMEGVRIDTAVLDRVGWVIVHSVWQFALIAGVAGLQLRLMRRCSAAARYAGLLTAMSLVVVAPIGTWLSKSLPPSSGLDVESPRVMTVATASPGHRVMASPAVEVSMSPDERESLNHDRSMQQWSQLPSVRAFGESRAQTWLPWVVWVWCAGVSIFALRPLLSLYAVRRLRTKGTLPTTDFVQDLVRRSAKRIGLRAVVRVLQSTRVNTPIVVGYLRPVILLPVCAMTGLPIGQLEAILIHELAHVRRHDYAINFLQILIETLFFYHPCVWWLSRQIRIERENCCDDVALAVLGDRVDYARALLAVEELRPRLRSWPWGYKEDRCRPVCGGFIFANPIDRLSGPLRVELRIAGCRRSGLGCWACRPVERVCRCRRPRIEFAEEQRERRAQGASARKLRKQCRHRRACRGEPDNSHGGHPAESQDAARPSRHRRTSAGRRSRSREDPLVPHRRHPLPQDRQRAGPRLHRARAAHRAERRIQREFGS